MMSAETESMSAELADELASNDRHRDTRAVRIRNYALKQMGRSPAHCRHAILCDHDDPSLAKRLGSGVHSLILGGPKLLVYPGKVRRGKDYDAFVESNPGALILSRSEYETTQRTAESVRKDKLASQVLFAQGSVYEQTINWDWLGRSRRCTPDVRSDSHLVELKTTQNGSPDRFKWDALKFGYMSQLADYSNAIETSKGYAPRDVYIVAVEKKPPYVVSTYHVSPRDIEIGARQCRTWMERLLACEAVNVWPGYCSSIQDLEMPGDIDDLGLTFADDDESEAA
jgi:exodeoxyribonuclease VIII